MVWDGYIERPASLAIVFDKPKKRRPIEQDRESMQFIWRKSRFVAFMKHDRVRRVMATSATRHAISAIRIRLSFERSERHTGNARAAVAL